MKFIRYAMVVFLISMIGTHASYADEFYGIFSAGYVDNQTQAMEVDSPSYKLGVGYQFAPQWYVEGGFQVLAEKNVGSNMSFDEPSLEANGLYIAALGKASGQSGELFYRLGLLKADLKGLLLSTQECAQLEATTLTQLSNANVCSFDNGILAGTLGLGYDYYINSKWLIRFEVEHIRGESDFSANAAYIGLRLNF